MDNSGTAAFLSLVTVLAALQTFYWFKVRRAFWAQLISFAVASAIYCIGAGLYYFYSTLLGVSG